MKKALKWTDPENEDDLKNEHEIKIQITLQNLDGHENNWIIKNYERNLLGKLRLLKVYL